MAFSLNFCLLSVLSFCVLFCGGRSKECFGLRNPDGPLANSETIDANNSRLFEGCHTVKGNIVFQAYAFAGDRFTNTPSLTKEQLIKSFSSVKVITGHLQILSWHKDLHDFSVFSNLTTIRGGELFRDIAALVIQDTTISRGPFHLDQIKNLGFRSLKSIDYGNVYIGYLRGLCYEDTVNWTKILRNPVPSSTNFQKGVLLRNNKVCTHEKCHSACDDNGCWGPEDRDCVSCKYYSKEDRCVLSCGIGFNPSGKKCLAETKRCFGTANGFSRSVSAEQPLNSLRHRYTNCTYVDGNLEITWLSGTNDLSFLNDIEIVTGYVIIAFNKLSYMPLENLKIIRGQQLFGGIALHIALNSDEDQPHLGIELIGLKSLTEIQRGNVYITNNPRLCYVDTLNWQDIVNGDGKVIMNSTRSSQISCPLCHESCNGHCWGPSADDCQTLTKSICDRQCGGSRCRGPGPDDCCHEECASGCTGPTASDCLVCRHLNSGGTCQATCTATYDQQNSTFLRRYRFKDECVKICPENLLYDDNACVKYCKKGYHNVQNNRTCVPCVGGVCNTECFGLGNPDGPLANSETIDATNSRLFEGCNTVKGNILFQAYAFAGDRFTNTPPLTKEQLIKSFSSVKVITGYLQILSWHKDLHDFSVFSNLTTIRGGELFRCIAALVIQDTTISRGPFKLDQIKNLGFRSLKSIDYGNMYIGFLRGLCYEDSVNWTKILRNPIRRTNFEKGVLFRHNKVCTHEKCHSACDDNGCWGPEDRDCISCRNYSEEDRCVLSCGIGFYPLGKKCLACDRVCDSCYGSGPRNCIRCKYYSLNRVCLESCPDRFCGDVIRGVCFPCEWLLVRDQKKESDME